jgi:predicted DsbA family dithiol-disulfide isomerase
VADSLKLGVTIDVVSDVICPWCFLGKRRLDKALASAADISIKVAFRPFFLDPTIPPEGMDRRTYLVNKFGEGRLSSLHDPLIAAGKEDGVPFHFEKITRTPSSLNAHRLLRWAQMIGSQSQVKEALFMAYWRWGQDISDLDVLTTIAIVNGFRREDIRRLLESDEDVQNVLEEAQLAQRIGITGVPTFLINRKYAMVGAQPVAALLDMIRKAAAEPVALGLSPASPS